MNSNMINGLVVTTLLLILLQGCHGGQHERRLLNDILTGYNSLERPVVNESESIIISFGVVLQQIIDVDEKNQLLLTNVWLRLEWIDSNLRWNISEYGNVADLRIPPNKIWKPDILMYNSADERFDSTFQTNVVVRQNGSCLYIPPGIFKSSCKIDITWFPFDEQKCEMKFGSWTYDGFALDLRLSAEEADLSDYVESGEWLLVGVPAKRNEKFYACCAEPYIDVTFTIHLRRKTLYFGFNLIIPCCLISSITLLGFTLPPESGEKLSLGVTILLSMSVFMLQLSDVLPPTSDAVSVIGTYFASIMMMVAFSVVMTVMVLNFHHKTRNVLLVWLPYLLRMEVPGTVKPPPPQSSGPNGIRSCADGFDEPSTSSHHHHHHHHDLRKPSVAVHPTCGPIRGAQSMSMMDMPIPHPNKCHRLSEFSRNLFAVHNINFESLPEPLQMKLNEADSLFSAITGADYATHSFGGIPPPRMNPMGSGMSSMTSPGLGLGLGGLNASRLGASGLDPGAFENDSVTNDLNLTDLPPLESCQCLNPSHNSDISDILNEIKFITNRLRKDDEIQEIVSEWRGAAMVIDRLCLILFTAFAIFSSLLCITSAPHLIV